MAGRTAPFAHQVPIKNVIPTTRAGTRGAQLNTASLAGATAAFAAALAKDTQIPLAAATAAFAATLVKKTLIPLAAATASLAGALVKKTFVVLAGATASLAGVVAKKTLIPLAAATASLAATINGAVVFTISFSAATAAFSATLIKKTLIPIAASKAAFAGALIKKTFVPLAAATASLAGAIAKKTLILLAGTTASYAATLAKKTLIPITAATASLAGTLAKKTLLPLAAATASLAGVIKKKTFTVLSGATASFAAALAKKTFLPLAGATASFAGSTRKLTAVAISAGTSAFSAAISESGGGGTTFLQTFSAALVALAAVLSAIKLFGSMTTVGTSGLSPSNPGVIQTTIPGTTLFSNKQTVQSPFVPSLVSWASQYSMGQAVMANSLLADPDGLFGPGQFDNSYTVVASGDITIPLSAINASVNLVLSNNWFWSQGSSIGSSNRAVATLSRAQSLVPGTYTWSVVCHITSIDGGMKIDSWTITIGSATTSGQGNFGAISPYPYCKLNLSCGVLFAGAVSGSDYFQARCMQFALQQ
jgi:hypothetical protein